MSVETAVSAEPAATTLPGEIPVAAVTSLTGATAGQSQLRRNLRRFLIGNKLNLVGLVVVVLFFLLAIFGQVFAPYSPYAQDITGSKLLAPSLSHPMGTDELGRDLLSRVMTGTRISLQVAVVVLSFAVVFGTLVGSVAGYFGGIVDEILMRFTDMFLAFPALILAIAIAASLGRELHWTMVALATVFWPWYARLVRGQILSIRERDFVAAAESIGLSGPRLLAKHILPNAVSGRHHPADARRRLCNSGDELPLVHWTRCATTIPGMGHDDVDCTQLLPRGVVVHDVSWYRPDADRLRLQRSG